MAMIFISHNLRLVSNIADKVCVMQAGKIVEQGGVWEIFEHPKHPYTRKLLNSLTVSPKLSDKKQKIVIIIPNESTSLIKYTQRGSNKSKDKIIYD